MKVSSFSIVGLGILFAVPATAQTLAEGKWTGTLNLTSGATIEVEFMVEGEGDAMQIVMKSVAGPPQPVTELELSDKELSFTWGAFTCSLERKGDSKYEGECGGAADAQLSLEAPTERSSLGEDVLTGEQLAETQQENVYEALRQLRPRWLRARGGGGATRTVTVSVYMGAQRMGNVDFLRSLDAQGIREIRFYTSSEATTRFGTDNVGGAIVITRR